MSGLAGGQHSSAHYYLRHGSSAYFRLVKMPYTVDLAMGSLGIFLPDGTPILKTIDQELCLKAHAARHLAAWLIACADELEAEEKERMKDATA